MARAPLRSIGSQHAVAIRLMAAGRGNQAIADELGVTPARVSEWRHDPLVQEELRRLGGEALEEARAILMGGVLDAARTLVAASSPLAPGRSKVKPLHLRAAADLLDRAGLGTLVSAGEGETMDPGEALAILGRLPPAVLRAILEQKTGGSDGHDDE